MSSNFDSPVDRLWREYSAVFAEFDDLSLARWMSQTLGQFQGRAWRLSHPLVGAYRLAAQIGGDRQIWLKRLVTPPPAYGTTDCCRAPLLPLITRDVTESGLICLHCNQTAVALDAVELGPQLAAWADTYSKIHAVAHWDETEKKQAADYQHSVEDAAHEAEKLLCELGRELIPRLAETYNAGFWEDQDECLGVEPEDIKL